jgi:hypothetical protein
VAREGGWSRRLGQCVGHWKCPLCLKLNLMLLRFLMNFKIVKTRIVGGPGVDVNELFSSPAKGPNKLECWSVANIFQSECEARKAYPKR